MTGFERVFLGLGGVAMLLSGLIPLDDSRRYSGAMAIIGVVLAVVFACVGAGLILLAFFGRLKAKTAVPSNKMAVEKTERERRSLADRRRTAVHEAGHVIVAWFSEHGPDVYGVEICREADGTYSGEVKCDDVGKRYRTKAQILAGISTDLGGRAAEELVLGDSDSGSEDDLRNATMNARRMVTRLGMSERFGLRAYNLRMPGLSQKMLDDISAEIRRIVDEQMTVAEGILTSRRPEIDVIANALEDRGTLTAAYIKERLGSHARPAKTA